MIILPLSMKDEYFRPGVVSATICAGILFNTVMGEWHGWGSAPAGVIVESILEDPFLLDDALYSLVRGAGPVSALFLALFWLVFGHSLEQRIGSLALGFLWLIGCLIPLPLAHFGLIALEKWYWLGLGGCFFCMGVSYVVHTAEEVTFFYLLLAIPFWVSWGTSAVAGVVPLLFIHITLSMAQIVQYSKDTLPPPPGMATSQWLFLYPFLPILVWLASRFVIPHTKRAVSGPG